VLDFAGSAAPLVLGAPNPELGAVELEPKLKPVEGVEPKVDSLGASAGLGVSAGLPKVKPPNEGPAGAGAADGAGEGVLAAPNENAGWGAAVAFAAAAAASEEEPKVKAGFATSADFGPSAAGAPKENDGLGASTGLSAPGAGAEGAPNENDDFDGSAGFSVEGVVVPGEGPPNVSAGCGATAGLVDPNWFEVSYFNTRCNWSLAPTEKVEVGAAAAGSAGLVAPNENPVVAGCSAGFCTPFVCVPKLNPGAAGAGVVPVGSAGLAVPKLNVGAGTGVAAPEAGCDFFPKKSGTPPASLPAAAPDGFPNPRPDVFFGSALDSPIPAKREAGGGLEGVVVPLAGPEVESGKKPNPFSV
jgi:hypothetical protein